MPYRQQKQHREWTGSKYLTTVILTTGFIAFAKREQTNYFTQVTNIDI